MVKNLYQCEFFNKIKNEKKLAIVIIIGPEGGFEQNEVDFLEKNLCNNMTKNHGSNILKAETTAVVSL